MELSWIGHACFRLRGRDAMVVTDPCGAASGYSLGRVVADLITVSNTHPNHAAVADVDGTPTVLDGPGEYEVKGVFVTGVRTTAGPAEGAAVRNTAYVIRLDDVTYCHLGDLSAVLSAAQLDLMKDVDVLFVPVGGHCTIGPTQATEVIRQVEPRLVVPMHYATATSTADLDPVDRFLREMGAAETQPQNRITITRNSLPAEQTVALLTHRG